MGLNLTGLKTGQVKAAPIIAAKEEIPKEHPAAHLTPFCQRFDRIKADYQGETARIAYMQKLAHKAADELTRVGEFAGRDKVHAAVSKVLPDRTLQADVTSWLDRPQEREALPSYENARADLKDFGLEGLNYRVRYCRKSGARIGTLNKSQVQLLAALIRDDDDCERYAETAMNAEMQILHHNGIAPVWYDTSPETLARLRVIDPAGYAVYLLSSWYHGSLIANSVADLRERASAYAMLKDDDDLLAKVSVIEVMAKSAFAVSVKERSAKLSLEDVACLSLPALRKAASQYIVSLIKRLTKTADHERARLSMAIFYRLEAQQEIPMHLRKIKLGKRTTPQGDTATAMWALSHADGTAFEDALDFELAGAIAHETTLGKRDPEYDELDELEDIERDWIDDIATDDTLDALEQIPTLASMVASIQGAERQAGSTPSGWFSKEAETVMSGDVFDDLF